MTSGIMAFLHHLAAFALAGLISIYPTIRFVSWNKFFAKGQPPEISDQEVSRIKLLLRLELMAIALILFSAAMMARGVGMI